jgi:iron complex outermembrane receptor protein
VTYQFLIADVTHTFGNDWNWKTQVAKQKGSFFASYYYPFGPAGAYGLGQNEVYFYTFDVPSRHSDKVTFDTSLGGDFELGGQEHQFLVALEYHGDDSPNHQTVLRSVGLGTLNIFEGGRGVLSDGTPIPLIDRSTLPIASSVDSELKQYRASVQLLFNPTDRLHILAGELYEEGDQHQEAIVGSGGIIDDSYSQFLGRLSVTYDLIKNRGVFSALNVYGSYNQGFSPNTFVRDPDGNFVDKNQTMDQAEIGIKAEMFDGALGASLAAYTSSINNIGVTSAFLGDVGIGTVLAGKRDADGIELELIGTLTGGWNVAFNYAYTDTKITDPNYPGIDVQAQMVPHHAAGLFTTYEWLSGPLAGLRLGGGYFYKSKYRLTANPALVDRYGNLENPSYGRADLSASYRHKGLEFFANIENVLDQDYFMTWEAHPGFSIVHGEPRTYKGGIRYSFE